MPLIYVKFVSCIFFVLMFQNLSKIRNKSTYVLQITFMGQIKMSKIKYRFSNLSLIEIMVSKVRESFNPNWLLNSHLAVLYSWHRFSSFSILLLVLYWIAVISISECKTAVFGAQNSLFCVARQWVLEFKITGSIIYWKSCSYKAGDFYGFISALKAYSLCGKWYLIV